jgi:hypothetical protein
MNRIQPGVSSEILLSCFKGAVPWKWVIIGIALASMMFVLTVTLFAVPHYPDFSRIETIREQKISTMLKG